MINPSLISIIMPLYNSGKYAEQAIDSVLKQTYSNWELLIINDGSTDNTTQIVESFKDKRILYFEQENKGVSAARNLGLKNMKGDYFCFLDGDDLLTKNSLISRLQVFNKSEKISFVDGVVTVKNTNLNKIKSIYTPSYNGDPLEDLVKLTGKSFFGNTWMIKRKPGAQYQFPVGVTHGEELIFYISISEGGLYAYTNEQILTCRYNDASAMRNLDGLSAGYNALIRFVKSKENISLEHILYLRRKVCSIMFKSYFKKGKVVKAITYYLNNCAS